jgi:hypothetical protein
MKLRCLKCFPVGAAILACGLFASAQSAEAQTLTYSGEAKVAGASVLGLINVSIEDTGQLPSSGGSLSKQLLHATVPGVLDLHLLSASTNGANNETDSHASVATATVTVPGIYITADVLTSSATASCSVGQASASGSSVITALHVNGLSITVTGQPNQTIPLVVGSLVINEQISSITTSPSLSSGDMLVNALHLSVTGVADVVVSSSHAGVSCSGQGPCPFSLRSRNDPLHLRQTSPAEVPESRWLALDIPCF